MSFGREKRLLLGLAAALAPLPLPFNGVIGWPTLALFWAALGWFLVRNAQGAERWLPAWAKNLLALAYLPFLAADLSLFWRGRMLQPLLHLVLFALAVKLFSLERERDKWHALLAIFFVFLAAAGTSVHPSVLFYLLGFLALGVLILLRFAGFQLLATAGSGPRPIPAAGFVAGIALLATLGSIPLFALLPRLRQPYLVAPGGGSGVALGAGRFLDRIGLDELGEMRSGRSVVFRFSFDNARPAGTELRFRSAAYDSFRDDTWRRSGSETEVLRRGRDGFFRLAPGPYRSWMTVWLKSLASARLVLPAGARALDLPARTLARDRGEAVSLPGSAPSTLSYRVALASTPPPAPEERTWPPGAAELDDSALSPAARRLAAEVMGEGSPADLADRLESHLMREYAYTLEPGARGPGSALDRFLFDTRAGHCEYFATAMVLMLRSRQIPARLVSGYLGAEFNPLEGYFIVRQSNAHAWVEAYLPGEGWRRFDPTPPAGRPGSPQTGLARLAVQAWDYLLFRWDRYVLTYGFYDQVGFLVRVRELLSGFWSRWREPREATPSAPERASAEEPETAKPAPAALRALRWVPLLLLLLAALVILRRRREGWTAGRAYLRLRRLLERAGEGPVAALAPLAVERRLLRRFPAASVETRRLISLYLEESFGGRRLAEEEQAEIRSALGRVDQYALYRKPWRRVIQRILTSSFRDQFSM